MQKKYIIATSLVSLVVAASAMAAIIPGPGPLPTSVDDCKKGGWKNYDGMFKNQGDCVSFVVTEGGNEPDGPNAE